MDSDTRRLEAQVGDLNAQVTRQQRDMEKIQAILQGKLEMVVVLPTGVTGSGQQHKIISQPMGFVDMSDDVLDHPWKVVFGAVPEGGNDADIYVDVTGGDIASQGAFNNGVAGFAITVMDSTNLKAGVGYIVLEMTRNSSTREVTAGNIKYYGNIPESTETTQYKVLAQIYNDADNNPQIRQLQFEDINIFEDLAVLNGEFKLVPLAMAGANPYALP